METVQNMVRSKPFILPRWYNESEVIDSFEIDWYFFYKTQYESSGKIRDLRNEYGDECEDEEEFSQMCFDNEAVCITLCFDKDVPEDVYEKALNY